MTSARAYEAVPTLETFGARLAIIRWSKGWNIKEAALACRQPEASWREWESGRNPRKLVEIASAISEATGYSDYWIMTGREVDPAPGGGSVIHLTSGHARTGVCDTPTPRLRAVA